MDDIPSRSRVTVPTLTVVGRAERDVVPDRVVVSVAVRTPMLPVTLEDDVAAAAAIVATARNPPRR